MFAKCQKSFQALTVVLWIVRRNVVGRVGQLVAARLVALGLLEQRALRELLARLAQQGTLVRQELLEARLAQRAPRALLELREPLERPEHQVPLAPRALLELREPLERPEHQVLLAPRAQPELYLLVKMAH
jgi:hypothetical protein